MRIITTLSAIALIFTLIHSDALAKKPRTAKRNVSDCYHIKCTGTSATCFIFSIGHGMEVGVPGVASITKVPCPRGTYGTNPMPADALFVVYSGDVGFGWTNIEGDAYLSEQEAGVTVYDDSQSFTSLAAWQAAN